MILCGIDGSENSERVAAAAIAQGKQTGAKVIFLSVIEDLSRFDPYYNASLATEVYAEMEKFFNDTQQKFIQKAKEMGVSAESLLKKGHPAQEILAVAAQKDIDMVVLGRHGHRIEDFLFGSNMHRVLIHGEKPTLIIP